MIVVHASAVGENYLNVKMSCWRLILALNYCQILLNAKHLLVSLCKHNGDFYEPDSSNSQCVLIWKTT